MADNTRKKKDNRLGGTQGGTDSQYTTVGGPSGGTNSVSPTGASQPDQRPAGSPAGVPPDQHGTANRAKQDAAAAFEDGHMQPTPKAKSRRPSGTEAKQWARDEANVDTTSGTPNGGVESPPGTRHDAGRKA